MGEHPENGQIIRQGQYALYSMPSQRELFSTLVQFQDEGPFGSVAVKEVGGLDVWIGVTPMFYTFVTDEEALMLIVGKEDE